LGYIRIFTPAEYLQITDANLFLMSEVIHKNYLRYIESVKKRKPQGFNQILKLLFYYEMEEKQKKRISIVIDPKNKPLQLIDITKKIKSDLIDKFNEGYIPPIFEKMEIFITKLKKKGGCSTCETSKGKISYCGSTIKLFSPKSTNDNCLFMCFIKSLGLKGNKYNFAEIRKTLNLGDGKIKYNEVYKVAEYFKTGFILLNEKQEIISHKELIEKPKVHICLMGEHYYICKEHNPIKCYTCGKTYFSSNIHKCNFNVSKYYNRKVCDNNNKFVNSVNIEEKQKINDNDLIFFDLETFEDTKKSFHVPYACGYTTGKNLNVNISYGKNCCDDLLNYLNVVEDKFICAYNGSGFDFYILLNLLKDKGHNIDDIILANGSILSFKFGKNNKVFDLYRFINSSLDNACNAYKIKNHKIKFDVLKIQSWELAEKYRNEVEPYLKFDVLSLSELFFAFNDFMFETEKINITKYITLSHLSYCIWSSKLEEYIELPDLKKYDFIKRATYGARTYPLQKNYKSKLYDEVINNKTSYDELIKSQDYIFNADVSSLYSASMKGFDLIETKYPIGKSYWSEEPEKQFKNNKIGFYEIEFECPKDLIIPILPRKTQEGGLEWSLYNGVGVYTSEDVKNSINAGYKVKFINKCLIYEKTGNPFIKYVDKFYQMKKDADEEKNDVKRGVAKLMLNALYGKMLQKAIFNNTQVINNYSQLMEFYRNHTITDICNLDDNKLLISGDVIEKESRITKPCQLGAFILGYSRSIMLFYMKAIDPELKTHIFTYTDTDSLHIIGKHAEKLKQLGYIKNKNDVSIGFLCSDIKNEGVIIAETNHAPKTYFYEYIDNKNELHLKENGTMKAKGIPYKCLDYNYYLNEKPEEVEFSGLKRKHKNLTKEDINKNLPHFSIINNTQKRTFLKTEWKGMIFQNNKFYPKGYIF
jgi:uncharacterized protein YprB with RNaseH-like and TPR domain